jgi:hypothetical protein
MTLEQVPPAESMARWISVLGPAAQLAERIADTEFVPKAMRGKPDVVCAAVLYGDELEIGPMQALAGIHVVEGRPQPSAELMRALILRAGHSIAVHEMTGSKCRVSGLRAGRPEAERFTVEWTLDMARAAGLLNRSNWRSYPRAMLLARATSDLARLLFPDVIKGLSYIAEDESAASLEAWQVTEPNEPEPKAPPRRRRAPAKKATASPRSLPSPPHLPPATDAHPAPDGSVDVPLDEWSTPPTHAPQPPPPDAVQLPGEPESSGTSMPPPVAPVLPETPPPDRYPEAEPEGAPERISDQRRGGVMASFARIGLADPSMREIRLALTSALIGRPITTTKQVYNSEALSLMRQINDIETGALAWTLQPDGTATVHPGVEPPGSDPEVDR